MFSSSSFDDTNASSSSVAVVGTRGCRYYFLSSSVARSRRGVQKTRRSGGQHFQRSFLPFFLSKSLFSLSLCVRGKNNNAVSLSLSIYLSIYLFTRVVVFDDDIFFNSANERSAHTPDDDDDDDGSFVGQFFFFSFSAPPRRLSLSFCARKNKKKVTRVQIQICLSSFLSLPLFNLFRV